MLEYQLARGRLFAAVRLALVSTAILCAAMLALREVRIYRNAYAMRSLDAMWRWRCKTSNMVEGPDKPYCFFGSPWGTSKNKAIIWGDSHAGHFAPLIEVAAPKDMSFLLYTNCPPIFGGDTNISNASFPTYVQYCEAQRKAGLRLLSEDVSIRTVILIASWSYLPERIRETYNTNGLERFGDELTAFMENAKAPGRRFIIIGSVPQLSKRALECAKLTILSLPLANCDDSETIINRSDGHTIETDTKIAEKVEGRDDAFVITPSIAMCATGHCILNLNDEVLYRDNSHIRRNLRSETKVAFAHLLGFDAILRIIDQTVASR
jgi:hypothetical protein